MFLYNYVTLDHRSELGHMLAFTTLKSSASLKFSTSAAIIHTRTH